MTPQGGIDDLTVINFEDFQRSSSSGYFRGEATLSNESIPLLEPPTTGVTARTVTEDPPPVTVSFRFPIAPAPVPVGLAVAPAPLLLLAVTVAPALVALDTADVKVAEPQALDQPRPPT